MAPELPRLHPLMPKVALPLTGTSAVEFKDCGEYAVAPTFEELGIDHGLLKYEMEIAGPREPAPLELLGLRQDRQWLDGYSVSAHPLPQMHDHAWTAVAAADAPLRPVAGNPGRAQCGDGAGTG